MARVVVNGEVTIDFSYGEDGLRRKVSSWVNDFLAFPNPEFEQKKRMGLWTGNTPREVILYKFLPNGNVRVPFGCLNNVLALMPKGTEVLYLTNDRISAGLFGKASPSPLRPYQEDAVRTAVEAGHGVIVSPCGSGKTQMGLEIARRIGARTLWLTHTDKLLDQSRDRALAMFPGIKAGTIRAGRAENVGRDTDIVFASVQTFHKDGFRNIPVTFGCVIVDECHHCAGSYNRMTMFAESVSRVPTIHKFGLTATPGRADGLWRSVEALLGGIIVRVQATAEALGRITARMVQVDTGWKGTPGMYRTDGTLDFVRMVTDMAEDEDRNRLIASSIAGYRGDRQIVLSHRVSQCERIAELLRDEHGIDAVAVAGKNSKASLDAQVICATYQLAKEGLDVPALSVLHMCTPIKDRGTLQQCVGRVERTYINKTDAIVVDYVDRDVPYCARSALRRAQWMHGHRRKEF